MTLLPQRIAPSRSAVFLALALLAGAGVYAGDQARGAEPAAAGVATLLEINGPIGPATSHYVVRGLDAAQKSGARLVILEIDTPGGSTAPCATSFAPSSLPRFPWLAT